jgi:hypothetical protein
MKRFSPGVRRKRQASGTELRAILLRRQFNDHSAGASMTEMDNPNGPASTKGRNANPRGRWIFFAVVLFVYVWQGFVTGNWTHRMSEPRREMFYISLSMLAAYFIWKSIRFLFRPPASKSD